MCVFGSGRTSWGALFDFGQSTNRVTQASETQVIPLASRSDLHPTPCAHKDQPGLNGGMTTYPQCQMKPALPTFPRVSRPCATRLGYGAGSPGISYYPEGIVSIASCLAQPGSPSIRGLASVHGIVPGAMHTPVLKSGVARSPPLGMQGR